MPSSRYCYSPHIPLLRWTGLTCIVKTKAPVSKYGLDAVVADKSVHGGNETFRAQDPFLTSAQIRRFAPPELVPNHR